MGQRDCAPDGGQPPAGNAVAARYIAIKPGPDDLVDPGFEDTVIRALAASSAVTILGAIVADLDPGEAELISAAIVASMGTMAALPLSSTARVQLYRLRKRIADAIGKSDLTTVANFQAS